VRLYEAAEGVLVAAASRLEQLSLPHRRPCGGGAHHHDN